MFGRNLLPSLWNSTAPAAGAADDHPFSGIRREMNRIFDDFFRGMELTPRSPGDRFHRFVPSLDIRENDKEITIKAELPGMDEKDVELLLTDNALTIKGEKKEEKEEQGKDYCHMECIYGSFQRVVPLPEGIDMKKAEAEFKKGILSITLPKTDIAKVKGKKIEIKAA
ncbi:MAG: Hsp20/alpha crystallin family protein [Pseudomonadota bacterium]|nr:Hsp20/alpha crystallin family protein [Pseudomonadota bacterium]